MRLNGLILKDKTLISHMDNQIQESSNIVNVALSKDGEVKGNNTVTLDEFMQLQKETKKILKEISSKILNGKIDVLPYWKNKEAYGCKYCQYISVCKFNTRDSKCKYNIMKKI